MTVLQSLDRYYGRMAARGEAEPFGYSRESIGLAVVLSPHGELVGLVDLNSYAGRKPAPQRMAVPRAVIRTSGVASNFLWDKTAYALGVTAGAGRRTAQEHAEFKRLHGERLAGTNDEGLCALLAFLDGWEPARLAQHPDFRPGMLDANVVFRLDGPVPEYLHQRPAAARLIEASASTGWRQGFCLVTGTVGPIERLHPPIKGVDGAQTAGARIVSYNANAFTSYGAEDGANAPTSEAAAFRYGTALNALLDRKTGNRLKVGDATVVYWADADGVGEASARAAEEAFDGFFDPPSDETEAAKVRRSLEAVAKGRPVADLAPELAPGTRFHVLGLAPNAARLSVRFWLTDTFGTFAARLARHYQDIAIEPPPWREKLPAVQRLLVNSTALLGKFDNIPPLLAGEVTRAVLEGTPYPRTLLSQAILRLRAGDDPGRGWHAAVIKACINRSNEEDCPWPVIPTTRRRPISSGASLPCWRPRRERRWAGSTPRSRTATTGRRRRRRRACSGRCCAVPASTSPTRPSAVAAGGSRGGSTRS